MVSKILMLSPHSFFIKDLNDVLIYFVGTGLWIFSENYGQRLQGCSKRFGKLS